MIRAAGIDFELDVAAPPAWLRELERPGRPALAARITLIEGIDRRMRPLALRREGARVAVSGDGLNGFIDDSRAELSAHGGEPGLRTALRLLCAVWGAPRGIVLFHGACALREGRARAFVGASGAGKTTLSRLWLEQPGATLVSDEVTAVDASAGRVYGHPFQSALGDGRAPDEGALLSSIDLIEHGLETRTASLSKGASARELLPRIFLPLRDTDSLRAALGAVAALVDKVPIRRLQFTPDRRALAA
jgi:hypothetical protein